MVGWAAFIPILWEIMNQHLILYYKNPQAVRCMVFSLNYEETSNVRRGWAGPSVTWVLFGLPLQVSWGRDINWSDTVYSLRATIYLIHLLLLCLVWVFFFAQTLHGKYLSVAKKKKKKENISVYIYKSFERENNLKRFRCIILLGSYLCFIVFLWVKCQNWISTSFPKTCLWIFTCWIALLYKTRNS